MIFFFLFSSHSAGMYNICPNVTLRQSLSRRRTGRPLRPGILGLGVEFGGGQPGADFGLVRLLRFGAPRLEKLLLRLRSFCRRGRCRRLATRFGFLGCRPGCRNARLSRPDLPRACHLADGRRFIFFLLFRLLDRRFSGALLLGRRTRLVLALGDGPLTLDDRRERRRRRRRPDNVAVTVARVDDCPLRFAQPAAREAIFAILVIVNLVAKEGMIQ